MNPIQNIVVVKEGRWEGLSVSPLSGHVMGILNCEMINARGIIWLLALCYGGGRGHRPSHVGNRLYVLVLLGSVFRVPL